MDRKMIGGLVLVLGIVSIALFTAPIHALANGGVFGYTDPDTQGMQMQDCEGQQLQQRTRTETRTQDGNCTGNYIQSRCQSRLRLDQAGTNTICNCIRHTEQYRYQNNK